MAMSLLFRPMGIAAGAVDQLSDGGWSSPARSRVSQASGSAAALLTSEAALWTRSVKMRVWRRTTRSMKGTQTRTMVTAKRQSVAGMVNSVMPKTD